MKTNKIVFSILIFTAALFADYDIHHRYPVVTVHGIMAFSEIFAVMEWRFEQEGYRVINFEYESTEEDIHSHGLSLGNWIKEHAGTDTVILVTHSMGNLVAREMHAARPDIEIYRWVMLAPPNAGARAADLWSNVPVYRWITNKPGQELRFSNPGASYKKLYPPDCPFAIIAGGLRNNIGFSLLLNGDDDTKVRVMETYLEGFDDHIIMPYIHSEMLFTKDVFYQVLQFIETGVFDHKAGNNMFKDLLQERGYRP